MQVEKLGLHGFIDKNLSVLDTLWAALCAIRRGQTFFSPAYLRAKTARQADPLFFSKILSDRECAVLALIGRSLSDPEIALLLGISVRTAQTHRSNILHKLNVESTPKLISFAIEHGFFQAAQ
jgi:DNA-binding NarL/FixJ family response regulator